MGNLQVNQTKNNNIFNRQWYFLENIFNIQGDYEKDNKKLEHNENQ